MDWCAAVRRIATSSAEIRRCPDTFDAVLTTLLTLLDHEDVLVAYAAKKGLQSVLNDQRVGTQVANSIVVSLISSPPEVWKRKSSGFRFQLLRELIKTPVDVDGDASDDDIRETVDGGEEPGCSPYLQVVLVNLAMVGATVRNVCYSMAVTDGDGGVVSVCYEALVFLSDLMKQLHGLENNEPSQVLILHQLVQSLMVETFMHMDFASQPAYMSCAVFDLFTAFHELLVHVKDQDQNAEEDNNADVFSNWMDAFLMWLARSSCTAEALRLLGSEGSSTTASQAAFICGRGQYPFLQQWILCICRIGITLVKLSSSLLARAHETEALDPPEGSCEWAAAQLPTRRQLFIVISEQDDVMIEVLNALTCIAVLADNGSGKCGHRLAILSQTIKHVTAEYDPDLLFADLVDILGRDHLVLLDLLVSNETRMLEYFMRYLRYLSAHWDDSKVKLHTGERLECVLSVLIRLRLEIDRLVTADLFPYNTKPLTRRLLAIEQLYESADA